ncbi:hypothetical protein [Pseudomonas sp. 22 E 5]|nr:hypothetical protein [Pseudomonas sp. 22 E 5]
MGTGADADKVAEAPVVQVVSRRAARLGIGRDFILRVTVFGQQRLAGFLNVPQRVVFRQRGRLVPEHGVGFQRQLIPRQVRGLQRDGLAQVAQGIVQRLIGQAVHQVQVEVIEPGLAGHTSGAHSLIAIMDAAQRLKLLLLEALDANGQAIDPQLAVRHELLLFEGAGVGFQGDFDIACKRNTGLHALEQAAQCGGAEQARRTATEEDRTQFAAVNRVQVLIKVGQQCVHILFFRQHFARGVGVEVAIRAFAYAPRNVDVQRQGRQHRQGRPRCLRAAVDQRLRRGVLGHFRLRRWRSKSIARARWLI